MAILCWAAKNSLRGTITYVSARLLAVFATARFVDPDSFQVNPDLDTDPTRIQGFDDQKLRGKNTAVNFFFNLFDQKLQFTYP